MKHKKFYLDLTWYYKLFLAVFFFVFLIFGLITDVIYQHWYISTNAPYSALRNYDLLLSFYSVQVNIMTIAWLILAVIFHRYDGKSFIYKTPFKLTLLNWNTVMFFIFWVGIIVLLKSGEVQISDFSKERIACTVVTHLISPLLFLAYVVMSCGDIKIDWMQDFAKKHTFLAISYPLFYFFYVVFRGEMYLVDNPNSQWAYPYPFMDLKNPSVAKTRVGEGFFIVFVFAFVFISLQAIMTVINNSMYYMRHQEEYKNRKWSFF